MISPNEILFKFQYGFGSLLFHTLRYSSLDKNSKKPVLFQEPLMNEKIDTNFQDFDGFLVKITKAYQSMEFEVFTDSVWPHRINGVIYKNVSYHTVKLY